MMTTAWRAAGDTAAALSRARHAEDQRRTDGVA